MEFMEFMILIESIISTISNYMYSYILIVLLIGAGIYFTVRTKFVQLRLFKESIRITTEKSHNKSGVSSFQALMISTASRVGTGNIVGVTGAILAGGPGAVFWMWITALLGSASAFIESTLAQIYKKKNDNGFYGGPAYYIKQALNKPVLGGIFAVILILTYMFGFNALASFNLTDFVKPYTHNENSTLYIGAIVAILAGIVIFGGGKMISKATQVLVPVMATIYIAVALIVMLMHLDALPSVIVRIFSEAFNLRSVFGGFFGACIMNGIKRGLYSNEAGIGSAPNAAASADVSHPAKQGIVQVLSVFIDTMLICSATAFLLLCSDIEPSGFIDAVGNTLNAQYIQACLHSNFGVFGEYFITISLVLFAYTTLVGNFYYAEMNISYLYKKAHDNKLFMCIFRLIAILVIFIGAQISVSLAWNLADVLMGFMALINIPVCIILAPKAIAALKDYEAQRKEGKNPVFKAKNIGLDDTECWK